jgi:hypothetical protein
MQFENMYSTCMYYVHTRIYPPKQVHTCYKQAKARNLHVFQAIKKCTITRFEPRTLCIPASCLNHYATSVHASIWVFTVYEYDLPGRWCCASGAGPAAPHQPAMTLPARASTGHGLLPQRMTTVTGPGSNQVNLTTLPGLPCVKSTGKY